MARKLWHICTNSDQAVSTLDHRYIVLRTKSNDVYTVVVVVVLLFHVHGIYLRSCRGGQLT